MDRNWSSRRTPLRSRREPTELRLVRVRRAASATLPSRFGTSRICAVTDPVDGVATRESYPTQTHPDQAGSCVARGGLGTSCGGIAGLPCDAGLVCLVSAPDGTCDAVGTCTKP